MSREQLGTQMRKSVVLVALTVIVLGPVFWVLATSLKTAGEVFAYPVVWVPIPPTIANFLTVLTRTKIPIQILNTVMVSAGSTLITFLLAALAGYGFSRYQFRFKNLLLISLLSLQMLPITVNIVPIFFFAARLNLLNTHIGLILVFSAIRIPIVIWILKGFFDGIPKSIEEAAFIDGASRLRVLGQIVFPLVLPGIAAATILTVVYTWNQFLLPLVMASQPEKTLATVGVYNFAVEESMSWQLLTSASILSVAPVVVLYLFTQNLFISGLTRGAGK